MVCYDGQRLFGGVPRCYYAGGWYRSFPQAPPWDLMDRTELFAPSFSFGGVFVVYTMVHAVRDLIYAFTADDMGGVITALCVMGACVALFRLLRRGAGG